VSPLKTDESGEESTGSPDAIAAVVPHSSEFERNSISSLSSTEYNADNFPRFSLFKLKIEVLISFKRIANLQLNLDSTGY
jgi:hypothetical protein